MKKILMAFLAIFLICCSSIDTPTIEIYKKDCSIQCFGFSITIDVMIKELIDNDIKVISSYKDIDGQYHPTACGMPTGNINVFEINTFDYKLALELGYQLIDDLKIKK